jgi:hypothetical protein
MSIGERMSKAFKCDRCQSYFDNKDHMKFTPVFSSGLWPITDKTIYIESEDDYCERCLCEIMRNKYGKKD